MDVDAVRDAAARFWDAGSAPVFAIQRELAAQDLRRLGINIIPTRSKVGL